MTLTRECIKKIERPSSRHRILFPVHVNFSPAFSSGWKWSNDLKWGKTCLLFATEDWKSENVVLWLTFLFTSVVQFHKGYFTKTTNINLCRRGLECVNSISPADKTPSPKKWCPLYDVKLQLIVRHQFWISREYRVHIHCCFYLELEYLSWFHVWVK